jgi:DNA-binding transcriptional LysR family regulator
LLDVPILKEPFMLFCCDAHPLSKYKSVTWSDLRSAELIKIGGQSANRVLIDYQLTRKRIALDSHYEVQHLSTALGMVAACVGVGVAILPFSTMGQDAAPGVCRIPLVGPVISRTLAPTRRAGSTLSPAAQAFYEMLHAELTASVMSRPIPRP